jgi:hypothetical protein
MGALWRRAVSSRQFPRKEPSRIAAYSNNPTLIAATAQNCGDSLFTPHNPTAASAAVTP